MPRGNEARATASKPAANRAGDGRQQTPNGATETRPPINWIQAKVRRGLRSFGAQVPANQAPAPSPPMNAPSTHAVASTVLPREVASQRAQTISIDNADAELTRYRMENTRRDPIMVAR